MVTRKRGRIYHPVTIFTTTAQPPLHSITLLSQIRADTSRHSSESGSRDAHRLGRDKHSLIAERGNARDLLAPAAHLLRVLVFDALLGARLDADRFRLRGGSESRRVCVRLGFDACALGNGFGGCNGGIRFCVGFRLRTRSNVS
jgi:hypothetical protein